MGRARLRTGACLLLRPPMGIDSSQGDRQPFPLGPPRKLFLLTARCASLGGRWELKLRISSLNHKSDCHLLRGWEPRLQTQCQFSAACHSDVYTSLLGLRSTGAGPAAWEINLGRGALGICGSGCLQAVVGEEGWMCTKLGHGMEVGRLFGFLSATCQWCGLRHLFAPLDAPFPHR